MSVIKSAIKSVSENANKDANKDTNKDTNKDANKSIARVAGIWYLLIAIFYSFSMIYVDSAIYDSGSMVGTINNIFMTRNIFYLGFVACLAGHVCFLFLSNTLYKLFKPIDENLSRLMVNFVVVGVAISSLSKVHQLSAFLLFDNPILSKIFETEVLHGLAYLLLTIYKNGGIIAMIFWGLWLLPLGILIIKSDYIPRIIGIMLISAGMSYIIEFFLFYFSPNMNKVLDPYFSIIETVAEVTFILWLLIKGVKEPVLYMTKHKYRV